jgi:hypothetical protein
MALKDPKGRPSAAEFGRTRAFLAKSGASVKDQDDACGKTVAGRTRAEIATQLLAWLKTRPKG